MLNVSKAMTAGAVQEYFQEGGHDYYIDADNPPGIWGGNLAREFGLEGEVQKEHFNRMAEGYHPITGEDLVLRRNENRRSANDITISAPKDFSLIYLAETDPEKRRKLEQAFAGSCDWIMDQMEPDAATRVRAGGTDHGRPGVRRLRRQRNASSKRWMIQMREQNLPGNTLSRIGIHSGREWLTDYKTNWPDSPASISRRI